MPSDADVARMLDEVRRGVSLSYSVFLKQNKTLHMLSR